MTVDPEKLLAFADGELDAAGREEVERALAADPRLRAELDEQRRLRERLADHYGPVAAEEIPMRFREMLGGSGPSSETSGTVVSLAEARARRGPFRQPLWQSLGAVAATFALGIFAGQLILPVGGAPLDVEGGALVATGPLAAALETQLASAQAPDAEARIGLTFADGEGRPCRTFDTSNFSGLACRSGERWALVVTAAAPQATTGQYRQAGSSAVLSAAEDMMADGPLDAEAERAAMQAGWKIPVRRD